MKKYIMTVLLAISIAVCLIGCGKSNSGSSADAVLAAFPDSVSVLTAGWEQVGEEFPAMGGSFDNPVDNAPGAINLSDTDTMTYTLLIPEDVQKDITDAASLLHMMNANTFTGVAIRLDTMAPEEAAGKIKDAFMANQFMCGMPDKIKIITMGNYVVYAYGETANVDNFMKGIETKEHATVFADAKYE